MGNTLWKELIKGLASWGQATIPMMAQATISQEQLLPYLSPQQQLLSTFLADPKKNQTDIERLANYICNLIEEKAITIKDACESSPDERQTIIQDTIDSLHLTFQSSDAAETALNELCKKATETVTHYFEKQQACKKLTAEEELDFSRTALLLNVYSALEERCMPPQNNLRPS